MNVFKTALLGAAALSAVSFGARADNLSDLKAQIEALNARVASIETAPAVPAGYQMVSFSRAGDQHIISIMPTADLPATTTITWTGNVRAGVMAAYDPTVNTAGTNSSNSKYSTDVWSAMRLKVVGKTDTAVGEVGVSIGFRADNDTKAGTLIGNPGVNTDGYYGWWKMTPNLTLSGGIQNPIQKGTLAKSGYTFDAICSCYETSWGMGSIMNDPLAKGNALSTSSANNPSQMTLSYADGPLGLAVSLEDSNNNGNNSAVGGSAKASYKMDTVGFDLNGGYWGNTNAGDASWSISAGMGASLGMIKVGGAVGTGHTGANMTGSKPAANFDYTAVSGYATVALGDQASLELGIVHDFGSAAADIYNGATLYEAGLYYTPVKQLVLGVEGQYQSGGASDTGYLANLVSVWKF
jgi:hypothetical protein